MESWMPGWWGLLVLAGAVLAVVNWLAQRRAVQPAHCPPAKPAKPANKKQPLLDLPDMEDLSRPVRSLIPETVRRMKADGVAPYTATDRRSRLDELNAHPEIPNFAGVLIKHGQKLQRTATTVLQANIGLYCNQACTHCHVDSSPKRKEMMSREVTDRCIELIRNSPSVKVVCPVNRSAPEQIDRWST